MLVSPAGYQVTQSAEKKATELGTSIMGNLLAAKVANGNKAAVTTIHQHVQWTTVAAITAIASLPEKSGLYVGDYRGHPKACHGIMEAFTRFDKTDI